MQTGNAKPHPVQEFLESPIGTYLVMGTFSLLAAGIMFLVGGSLAEVSGQEGQLLGFTFKAGGSFGGFIIVLWLSFYLMDRLKRSQQSPGGAAPAATLDLGKPVTKDQLDYQDVGLAIDRLVQLLRPRHPDLVVAIDKGGAIIGGVLAKRLGIPLRYLYRPPAGGGFSPGYDVTELQGQTVLLVDDCSRTGRTLDQAVALVQSHHRIKGLITAVALYTLPGRRGQETRTIPDCHALQTNRVDIKMPWDA